MGNSVNVAGLAEEFQVSQEEIVELKRIYKENCGGSRFLSRDKFRKVYNKVFPGDASSFADIMFNKFDTDGDGKVDMREFIVGLLMSDAKNVDQKIKFAFEMYDIDKSGTISRDEVIQISQAYSRMYNTDDGPTVADRLFRFMDKNDDDEISFEEFDEAARNNKEILNLLFPRPPEPV
ncbi:neurocalcin-delta B-like [Mizuhopecten yessoensis]|uniref:Neurocalcin-delta B n=1 Tax=Mizuhopecten yessoensis TaxID=6573 RepID=A0A210QCC1_MIZYE|nr:neurocalcin-delta B-like [Mizuhopecten yessoensis]XP_021361858.1 neurocalcin-delta B-like [Mizuhopecten yessoensis]OWF46378.1 Neurocalcin-delta B [Mizuhopecten yessoensis]